MNILTLCAALNNSYLAIEYENKVITKVIKSDENYHSLYLISKIKEIIAENLFDLHKLDMIAVNSGPGSFTGIRVAMTIAKVMASELNIPLVALTTQEILLKHFNKDVLIMDARRDLYYFLTKNECKLIPKNEIENKIEKQTLLVDKRSKEIFIYADCFEEIESDIGKTMLELAKNKYISCVDKEEFNCLKVNANYIQTPPIFN